MKRKLVMRPRADLDLIKHCLYLSEHQPRASTRLKEAVRAAAREIQSEPRSGARLNFPLLADVEVRFRKPRGFKNYLVIYQVTDDAIFVLRVLHASQDIESALRA